MTEQKRIEWIAERTERDSSWHCLRVQYDGDGCQRLRETEPADVVAWLRAAPEDARREVLAALLPPVMTINVKKVPGYEELQAELLAKGCEGEMWRARAEKAERNCLAAQNRHIKAERERNEARDARDRLLRELAEARAPKPSADLPLAPGSRWVDGEVVDAYGNRTRIMGNPGREWLRTIDRDDKRGSPYVADAIAVLARAGLLPAGDSIPRAQLYPLLVQCVEAGIGNTFIGRKDATGSIVASILDAYDRETKAGSGG